jgi:shikimate dehydrogenase
MTAKAGVVGWPVKHSLSPVLHGYWLNRYEIDGSFEKIAAKPEEFKATVYRLRNKGFRGVNVTVPHKLAAFKLAKRHDAAAIISRTANLLVFHDDGRIEGRNTDTFGLIESLNRSLGDGALAKKSVVILGAGGAARAAALALNILDAGKIYILGRHLRNAERVARDLSKWNIGPLKAEYIAGTFDDWPEAAKRASLLVNATSAGMKGMPPLLIDLKPLPLRAAVCDVVYNPRETRLLRRAKARGHKTIDGLGMLMYQAAPSFKAFFGRKPKVTLGLRRSLIRALRERQA